jgi:hypothetical protein
MYKAHFSDSSIRVAVAVPQLHFHTRPWPWPGRLLQISESVGGTFYVAQMIWLCANRSLSSHIGSYLPLTVAVPQLHFHARHQHEDLLSESVGRTLYVAQMIWLCADRSLSSRISPYLLLTMAVSQLHFRASGHQHENLRILSESVGRTFYVAQMC